jgi:hypothetical protein
MMESVQFVYPVQVGGQKFPGVSMLTDKPAGRYLEFLDLDMGNRLVRFRLTGDWQIATVPLENVASMVLESPDPPAANEPPEKIHFEVSTLKNAPPGMAINPDAWANPQEIRDALADLAEGNPRNPPEPVETPEEPEAPTAPEPEPGPAREPEKPQKRKRGRPKGSKNKRKGR